MQRLNAGETVSHYRILESLGAGGMGVVYKAEDERLGRNVALKFVAEHNADDPAALERFKREARAASALNHPNICTIFNIDEWNGQPFIAMELLDGRSLRERIRDGPASLKEFLDIGIQVAEGLQAAHAKGIVHRDIKPENIFLTAPGTVKILDFGLATLASVPSPSKSPSSLATEMLLTSPGAAVGTAAYMAPEQALGKRVDARADVFSLGAVLYELASGMPAFSGTTFAALTDALLHGEPLPPSSRNPHAPAAVDAIVEKCLRKNRELRYQTVADLSADLKNVQRTSSGSGSAAAPLVARSGTSWKSAARLMGGAAAALVLLAWLLRPASREPAITGSTQITSDGKQKAGFMAPFRLATDGARVYFSELSEGRLIVYQSGAVPGDTAPLAAPFTNMAVLDYSPVRSELLIANFAALERSRALFAVPMPAGGPRRLEATAFDARWSPDGTLLAYVLGPDLFLADSEGRSPRQIVSVPESILGRPVWSPDQASLRFTSSSNEGAPTIWEVRADGTGLRRVFREMPEPHESGAWTPDGRYFLYDARRNDTWDLWVTRERLRAFEKAGRGPFRLTTGPLSYRSPIFSRDGKRLFAIGEQKRGELVRFDERSGVFVPFLGGISADSLAWSPDGKWIAYISYPDSSLWRCAADGSSRLQLTRPPARAILPHWSPDSTEIAFSEQSVGGPHAIHTVSRDGGPLHRVLPENRPQLDADWSADGKSILFGRAPGIEHASSDQFTIQMVNLASGVVSVIPGSEGLAYPHFSPDRRYIAALSTDEKDLKLFDFETKKWRTLTSFNANYPAWTKDSRYLSFDTMFGSQPAIIRIDVQTGRFERTVTLKNVARTGTFGLWSGLSPEGSPLILRDVGTQEIYALDLLLP